MKKLPTEVKKELEKLAESLPPLVYKNFPVKTLIKGEKYKEAGVNETKDGKPINSNKYYVSDSGNLRVNHYKKLKNLFITQMEKRDEAFAWQAVAAYCEQVKHQANEK